MSSSEVLASPATQLLSRLKAEGLSFAVSEPLATTPAGAAVHGLEDVEQLAGAHAQNPRDKGLAMRLASALEAQADWPRLVAVLASAEEGTAEVEERVAILLRMAEAVGDGLGDAESAAECLVKAARLARGARGAGYARRAAKLYADSGLEEESRAADSLAHHLEQEDRWR